MKWLKKIYVEVSLHAHAFKKSWGWDITNSLSLMFQTFIMLQRFHLFDNIKIKSIINAEKWKWKNKVIKQKLENYNYKHDLDLRREKMSSLNNRIKRRISWNCQKTWPKSNVDSYPVLQEQEETNGRRFIKVKDYNNNT